VFKITCPPSVNATGLAATLPSWAIEKQDKLVHPYLIRHGIFVVTHHRDKRWQHPKTNKQMSFSALTAWLDATAKKLVKIRTARFRFGALGSMRGRIATGRLSVVGDTGGAAIFRPSDPLSVPKTLSGLVERRIG
jgi:hypothetical protein